ncbi:hypothetical protein O181_085155 [Austropuccinia psidii MF-1]|uniref:Vacuolar fusion protein MON1 n=1 Tax=Austropuccinia psidii MF-1 TaxID=1389203 RepID=A0A9Q3IMT3_9BASI|nr:hypothetical protein [Austropuccinia psidii MF-1]
MDSSSTDHHHPTSSEDYDKLIQATSKDLTPSNSASSSILALPNIWNSIKITSNSFGRRIFSSQLTNVKSDSSQPDSDSFSQDHLPSLLLDSSDPNLFNQPQLVNENVGPKVTSSHSSTSNIPRINLQPQDGQSDDSDSSDDGPPSWLLPVNRQVSNSSISRPLVRASPSKANPTSVISPVPKIQDSQTLLKAQLSKAQPVSSQANYSIRPTQPPSSSPNLIVFKPRKYYILTSAGKPVWSTEQDDDQREDGDVTAQMGLIQAVISIFEDEGDQLRYIDAQDVKIAVMLKPPLYFLVVSNWGEPESTLRLHLDYLHLLIQSIMSLTQLERIFERRPNHDLRRTLTGTECIFANLVQQLQWDFSMMLGSLRVFQCPSKLRESITKLITPPHPDSGSEHQEIGSKLLYSIVLAEEKVVSLVRPKKHSIHPSDLHIIITTVLSSSSLRTSESWIPICLPGYNSTGFLHAYIKFDDLFGARVGLIMISGDRYGFFGLKKWAEEILNHSMLWKEFSQHQNDKYSLEDVGITGLRHFVIKDKGTVQISYPEWEDDYIDLGNRKRLMSHYQRAHDLLHPKLSRDDNRPVIKFTYVKTKQEAIIAWMTKEHELYLTSSPLLSKKSCIMIAHSVIKWIKDRKDKLFLISNHGF